MGPPYLWTCFFKLSKISKGPGGFTEQSAEPQINLKGTIAVVFCHLWGPNQNHKTDSDSLHQTYREDGAMVLVQSDALSIKTPFLRTNGKKTKDFFLNITGFKLQCSLDFNHRRNAPIPIPDPRVCALRPPYVHNPLKGS